MTDRDHLVLRQLNIQAQELGIQYVGADPAELAKIVTMMTAARAGKPACFLRSYSPEGICRTCDLYAECGQRSIEPRVSLEPVALVECRMPDCDGDLIVVLYDDKGDTVDYGCSTPGCPNTLYRQRSVG